MVFRKRSYSSVVEVGNFSGIVEGDDDDDGGGLTCRRNS